MFKRLTFLLWDKLQVTSHVHYIRMLSVNNNNTDNNNNNVSIMNPGTLCCGVAHMATLVQSLLSGEWNIKHVPDLSTTPGLCFTAILYSDKIKKSTKKGDTVNREKKINNHRAFRAFGWGEKAIFKIQRSDYASARQQRRTLPFVYFTVHLAGHLTEVDDHVSKDIRQEDL